jgi:hypothetical protein
MTNALSLYLDALRFGAAFTVFLSHYAAKGFSGGLFWQAMLVLFLAMYCRWCFSVRAGR